MDARGKTVLITGGTDGIGLEVARQLKAKGAMVVVAARRPDRLESAAAEGLETIAADLSTAAGCAALAQAAAGHHIDILINNAGMHGNFGPDEPLDVAFTDKAIFLNLNAPMHLIGLMLEALKARPEAMIVNVTSGLAIAPRGGAPVYCATKAGLRSFTQALRHNLRETKVHVLEALPPRVATPLTARYEGKMMAAPDCARAIVAAIEGNHDEANIGQTALLRAVYSISPALARRVMLRF